MQRSFDKLKYHVNMKVNIDDYEIGLGEKTNLEEIANLFQ